MKNYCILSLVVILFSCSTSDSLDGKSYLSFIKNPENGLINKKEFKGIIYEAQFKPYEYIVLNEQKKYNLSKEIVEDRKKKLEGMVYYNLRISSTNQTDILAKNITEKQSYVQRINYLSYDFQSAIQLQTDKETINCGLYHFVHQQGITPYVDMVIGFPIKSEPITQTLIIDDQVFGNGTIKFHIDKKNIEEIPHLKTT